MAKTLLITLGVIASGLTVVSYVYYTDKSEKGETKDNLLFNLGRFVDDLWFNHSE